MNAPKQYDQPCPDCTKRAKAEKRDLSDLPVPVLRKETKGQATYECPREDGGCGHQIHVHPNYLTKMSPATIDDGEDA